MITVTEKAVDKIKEISDSEGIGHYSIRVKVVGGGCAGMTNEIFFEEKPLELDEVVEFGDVKIIVDPLSIQYLENVEIDYVEGNLGSGFKFNNPDVKSSCGCGHSYSV